MERTLEVENSERPLMPEVVYIDRGSTPSPEPRPTDPPRDWPTDYPSSYYSTRENTPVTDARVEPQNHPVSQGPHTREACPATRVETRVPYSPTYGIPPSPVETRVPYSPTYRIPLSPVEPSPVTVIRTERPVAPVSTFRVPIPPAFAPTSPNFNRDITFNPLSASGPPIWEDQEDQLQPQGSWKRRNDSLDQQQRKRIRPTIEDAIPAPQVPTIRSPKPSRTQFASPFHTPSRRQPLGRLDRIVSQAPSSQERGRSTSLFFDGLPRHPTVIPYDENPRRVQLERALKYANIDEEYYNAKASYEEHKALTKSAAKKMKALKAKRKAAQIDDELADLQGGAL